jgi:uracil-DNA glycosylase family 4
MKLFRITRTKSLCHQCPLDSYCTKVRGESASERPKIAFIGEAPGREEDESGHPFVGSAGKELDRVLAKAGLHRHNAYLLNLTDCRPPENDLDSPEGQEALEACRPGFEEELSSLHRLGVRTLVPLGAKPTGALGIEGAIHKVRGSVYEVAIAGLKFWTVPTFHPAYIIRGQWSEEPTMIADVEKAVYITTRGYTPPQEDFLLFPTVKDIEARTRDILKKKPLLGVDIETTGLRYWNSEIFVMALAINSEEAFSIPFYSQGYVPYWKNDDLARVKNCLYEILLKCPTMYQNAPFDVPHLEWHAYKVGNIAHDVLLIHHAIHPELPHNLGYIVSIYGATPYWKDIKLRFPVVRQMPDTDLRIYNCRDAVVLHQVLPSLLADLKETGTEHIYYNYSMKLIRPTLSITTNGMLLDRPRLNKWKKELQTELGSAEKKIRKLGNLPDEFNLQSPHHLSYWFYGELPRSLPAWKEEIASYDEKGSRKKKTSQKYSGLLQRVALYTQVRPLARSKSKTKRTNTGFAKDEKALLLSKLAATTEITLLSSFRRPTLDHRSRLEELAKLREALTLFQKRQKTAKLLSTYTDFEAGPDMRVHPSFKIHGTSTGRLSSGEGEE